METPARSVVEQISVFWETSAILEFSISNRNILMSYSSFGGVCDDLEASPRSRRSV